MSSDFFYETKKYFIQKKTINENKILREEGIMCWSKILNSKCKIFIKEEKEKTKTSNK